MQLARNLRGQRRLCPFQHHSIGRVFVEIGVRIVEKILQRSVVENIMGGRVCPIIDSRTRRVSSGTDFWTSGNLVQLFEAKPVCINSQNCLAPLRCLHQAIGVFPDGCVLQQCSGGGRVERGRVVSVKL